jgi:hypothetical protein
VAGDGPARGRRGTGLAGEGEGGRLAGRRRGLTLGKGSLGGSLRACSRDPRVRVETWARIRVLRWMICPSVLSSRHTPCAVSRNWAGSVPSESPDGVLWSAALRAAMDGDPLEPGSRHGPGSCHRSQLSLNRGTPDDRKFKAARSAAQAGCLCHFLSWASISLFRRATKIGGQVRMAGQKGLQSGGFAITGSVVDFSEHVAVSGEELVVLRSSFPRSRRGSRKAESLRTGRPIR